MKIIFIFIAIAGLTPLLAVCQSVADPATAAQAAFAAGKYLQAAELYEQALTTHLQSAELESDLGLAYQMAGEHPQAIHNYVSALRLKDLPRTKELLAIERCRLQEYAAAAPLLAQIAAHPTANDTLLPVLSPCYLQANDPLDALRVRQAMALSGVISPDQALVYSNHASIAASKFFTARLMNASGGAPYIRYLKAARDAGSLNARSGFPSAIKHSTYLRADLTLEEGLVLFSRHPDDPALLYMLSVLTGEQAMQNILDCQEKYPESSWLAQFQAEMLATQGHPQQAKAIYIRLLTAHPELPDLHHELAMLYRSQGEWAQALTIFRAELAADPADDRAVTGISESLIQLGRYAEAVDFLVPRFSKASAPIWASLDLSLAEQKLGKDSEAIGVLTQAEKAYPQEKSIHFRLMRLYTQTSQMDLAKKESTLFTAATHP